MDTHVLWDVMALIIKLTHGRQECLVSKLATPTLLSAVSILMISAITSQSA